MPLINPETIESFRALQTPKDPDFLKNFLTSLFEPMPKRLEDIRGAIETGDPKKLEEAAHAIKSSCLNIGAEPIVELCAKFEEIGRKGTVSGAQELYVKIIPLCDSLKKEIYSLPEFNQAA